MTSQQATGAPPHNKIAFMVSDFKPLEKATLRGVFTLSLPSGIQLREVMLHQRENSRWVALPGGPYVAADGVKKYAANGGRA